MGKLGNRIEETGTLIREGDIHMLRRDLGGRYRLDVHRFEVPPGECRVQVAGVLVGDDLVDVTAFVLCDVLRIQQA